MPVKNDILRRHGKKKKENHFIDRSDARAKKRDGKYLEKIRILTPTQLQLK
jgi:ribosomal protein S16